MEDLSKKDVTMIKRLKNCVYKLCKQTPESYPIQKFAVDMLKQILEASPFWSDSLTDNLKLLTTLKPYYRILKDSYDNASKTADDSDSERKKLVADVLSVLSKVNLPEEGETREREALKYRLLGSEDDFTTWGLGYLKYLVTQMVDEYKERFQEDDPTFSNKDDDEVTKKYKEDFFNLVMHIGKFYMEKDLVIEAVDLAVDFEQLTQFSHLNSCANERNYEQTCVYMTWLSKFIDCDSDYNILNSAHLIYRHFEDYAGVLRVALRLGEYKKVRKALVKCDDLVQKMQLCNMLARHGYYLKLDGEMVSNDGDREELQGIINRLHWGVGYLALARYLDVMEPKTPEDVCKGTSCGSKRNLADAFVNAFVNAGFGMDKLVVGQQNSVFKNEASGKMSEVASLGLIMLWQDYAGLRELHKYMQHNDPFVKAGALLGLGILNSSVKYDTDPALGLPLDYIDRKEDHQNIRIGAVMGLGLNHAYSGNKQVAERLIAVIKNVDTNLELAAFAAISLGLVCLGFESITKKAADAIIVAISIQHQSGPEYALTEKRLPFIRLLCFGLGLLYLGLKESEAVPDILSEKMKKYCQFSWLSCAYVGSGDVDVVQSLLDNCDEEAAVLGISMVAIAEEVSSDKAIQYLAHLLQCGKQNVRKAVPLALSLLCISNPKNDYVINILDELAHETNSEVAMCAIISLGLVGSGTNNDKITSRLRALSLFYSKNDDALFCVQIAQGLLNLGKGLLTLNRYYSDHFLLSPVAIAGLVTFLHCCLDMRTLMLANYHFVLYFIVLAMQPSMLLTLDEDLKMIHVPVCVGQSADVLAAQFNGDQILTTDETPVLLGSGDKAVLTNNEYVPLAPVLEGFVILKHKPACQQDMEE